MASQTAETHDVAPDGDSYIVRGIRGAAGYNDSPGGQVVMWLTYIIYTREMFKAINTDDNLLFNNLIL